MGKEIKGRKEREKRNVESQISITQVERTCVAKPGNARQEKKEEEEEEEEKKEKEEEAEEEDQKEKNNEK